jgi:hypothetical protein
MTRAESAQAAIAAWLNSAAPNEQRLDALLVLIDTLINASIVARREAGHAEREALAASLVPLRAALSTWPPAQALPPYGALLGCLQALLRGDEPVLAALDDELRAMWARIAELATASADELRDQAVARNFAQAEQAVRVALEQSTEQQRAALAQQLEDGAREATQGEEPASPWQELAQFMRAAALVLRRLPVDGRTLSDANRHRIERLLTLARPAPAFESGAEELPASVLYALMHNDAAALEAALQALPTQERVQVVTALEQQMHEQMVQLSSDERQAVIAEAQQAQIADAADRARDVAIQALRSGDAASCNDLAAQIVAAAAQATAGEAPDSPWHPLAAYLAAVAALLREQPVPPIPPAYQERFAAIQAARA